MKLTEEDLESGSLFILCDSFITECRGLCLLVGYLEFSHARKIQFYNIKANHLFSIDTSFILNCHDFFIKQFYD